MLRSQEQLPVIPVTLLQHKHIYFYVIHNNNQLQSAAVSQSHICHDCTHYGIPYCTHIEGISSVQVSLKMAAMRPKYVAKNHQVVALNIVSFIFVVCDVKYICL